MEWAEERCSRKKSTPNSENMGETGQMLKDNEVVQKNLGPTNGAYFAKALLKGKGLEWRGDEVINTTEDGNHKKIVRRELMDMESKEVQSMAKDMKMAFTQGYTQEDGTGKAIRKIVKVQRNGVKAKTTGKEKSEVTGSKVQVRDQSSNNNTNSQGITIF